MHAVGRRRAGSFIDPRLLERVAWRSVHFQCQRGLHGQEHRIFTAIEDEHAMLDRSRAGAPSSPDRIQFQGRIIVDEFEDVLTRSRGFAGEFPAERGWSALGLSRFDQRYWRRRFARPIEVCSWAEQRCNDRSIVDHANGNRGVIGAESGRWRWGLRCKQWAAKCEREKQSRGPSD